MGREIRRVPEGWEHPKDDRGNYKPLYDETYKDAAERWMRGYEEFKKGNNDYSDYGAYCDYYWEYDMPPEKGLYRPAFESEPNCVQIYETVSEGTPVSPVFRSKDEMVEWLVDQGHDRQAALFFAEHESVPTMIVRGGNIAMGQDWSGQ